MDTNYNLQETIDAVQQLNFNGNIIPHTWFKKITFDNGKPDLLAMMILAEIIYWYRPVAVKNESTGELIGFKKKFKADKLQRSSQSFATQFGISKRQAADALKRLEQHGLISRELRTVNTAAGKLGNVLFIVPVVAKLSEIQSALPLMQSNVIGGTDDEPSDSDEGTPLGNQMHEGIHPDVIGLTSERSTYTENTTQITTKITAAATEANFSPPPQKYSFSENKVLPLLSIPNQVAGETLIKSNLTPMQFHKVDEELKQLHQEMTLEHPEQLKQEIICSLLDPSCFTKTGNNFSRKLKAISNSIRNRMWNTPLSLAQSSQKQRQTEINALKTELDKAQALVNYCNDMISYVKLYPDFNCTHAKAEKPKYEAQVHYLKAKLSAFIQPEKEYQKRELHYQAS